MKFDDYSIIAPIYESDISLIYRAVRKRDQIPVIIKMLNIEYPSSAQISKYKYEFDLIKSLDIDGVIEPYEIIEYGNALAIVEEDIEGISLKKLSFDDVPLRELIELFIEISQTLGEIHDKHVIHKDINPSNILWNRNKNIVKIIDFGIATKLPSETHEIRNIEILEGTLAYISPEQSGRMNRSLDYRGDYYSLGATFYEMLTGRTVFSGASDPMELVHYHIAVEPLPVADVKRSIPTPISNIVMKLLAKGAEERYQSIAGLIHDFEICISYLEENKRIEEFEIGKNDVSSQFIIPEKLYGRDREIETVNDIFENVVGNSIDCLLVYGYSGVGKSTLIKEIKKSVSEEKGRFVSGKFDQYKRNVPYSAMTDVLKEVVKQLLANNSEQMESLKCEILEVLGKNCGVITNFVPEFEVIMGEQEKTTKLSPKEERQRLISAFNSFFGIIATSSHPLAIFLDDLQWIDQASLDFISELIQSDLENILLIGAYRDNEVDVTHPLSLTMRKIESGNKRIKKLNVLPLNKYHINEMVTDTLKCEFHEAEKLTDEIMKKTNGNPFFATHLLNYLNSEHLIWFDKSKSKWLYDLEKIKKQNISDSIADLMASKITKLSDETQKVLEFASYLGNHFDLEWLSRVYDKPRIQTADALWEALEEGLIIASGDSYKWVKSDYDGNVSYKFLHDRVQQAAYSLSEGKTEIHTRIGLMMMNHYDYEKLSNVIFDIADHLNKGKELIENNDIMLKLMRINYLAAVKAKNTAAYKAAFDYCKFAIELVNFNGNEIVNELSLNIYKLMAEMSYLIGDYDYMEVCCTIVKKQTITLKDQTDVFQIQINAAIAKDNPGLAIDIALVALKELGLELPRNPNKFQLMKYLAKVSMQLRKFDVDKILDLPRMSSQNPLAIMDILSSVASSAYLAAQELFLIIALVQVELSLKYGRTEMTSNAFTLYAMILAGPLKQYDKAYHYGEIALMLSEKDETQRLHAKVHLHISNFIFHWKESKEKTMYRYLKAYQLGLENGDTEYAAWGIFFYSTYALFKGDNIRNLQLTFKSAEKTILKLNQEKQLSYNRLFLKLINHLADENLSKNTFEDEEQIKKTYENQGDTSGLFYVEFCKGILNIYFKNYDLASSAFDLSKPFLDGVISTNCYALFYYYDSLARLLKHGIEGRVGIMKDLLIVRQNQRKLGKWAELMPQNYEHCYYLVEAECYRIKGKVIDAEKAYDKAIHLSELRGYTQDEALASELAADFYKERKLIFIARNYISRSIFLYEKWGAYTKSDTLKNENSDVLISSRKIQESNFDNTSTGTHNTQSLDLTSIIKSSQALSKEVELDKLLKRFMKLIIENAGAQEGMIILEKNGQLSIEARWDCSNDELDVSNLTLVLDSDNENQLVALSLIQYVIHSKESVIINNALLDNLTKNDPHVLRNNTKSIVCIPIILKGQLRGLLYLENNLATDSFKMEHVETLKIMTTQAAISLENVRLYSSLEEKVKERTAELKELTEKYQVMSTMDQLTNIFNRRKLDEVLLYEFSVYERYNTVFSVIMLDIDRFKLINDTHGHAIGDDVLIIISNLLKSGIRKTETLGRWGGEEFMIICPNVGVDKSMILAEKLRKLIESAEMPFDGRITSSFGVSESKFKNSSQEVVKCADDALYQAKDSGRNKVIVK